MPQDNRGSKEPPGPHTDPVEPLSIEQQLHTGLQWTDVTGCEQIRRFCLCDSTFHNFIIHQRPTAENSRLGLGLKKWYDLF